MFPDLRLVTFDPKQVSTKDEVLSYELWKKVWNETFLKLEGRGVDFCDEFYRQDEAYALFAGEFPVAITMHSFFDLQSPVHLQHSYFKAYPKGTIEKVLAQGIRYVIISNQTAVHPEFRKSVGRAPMGDIIIGLTAYKLSVEKQQDAFMAYTNNSRKVHEICYRFGAKPIVAGHQQHNVEVDIVVIHKDEVQKSPILGVHNYIKNLYQQRDQQLRQVA